MADPRRIPITTVGPLKKDKKPKENAPTLRFNLVLLESNDKTCPEFNYSDLLKSARSKKESKTARAEGEGRASDVGERPHASGDDPFGDDQEDEKLKALARKFEEKYGPALGKKHRKKLGRIEDYIDLGMGYDENDPFIDNTDAYDELVPSTLTTQLGGFYINLGKLNFKEVHSDSSDEEILDTEVKKRRRKGKEKDHEKEGKRKKKLNKDGDAPKKRGRKHHEKPECAVAKVKKSKQSTVATLLLQQKAQPQASKASASLANGGSPAESVINASRDHDSNECGMTGSSDSEIAMGLTAETDDVRKLPEGLPSELEAMIHLIKETALKSEEGKCKFFSPEVNNMLLNIELKSRELQCSQRTAVYAHLANHLPCTKETLLKRAKKLRLDQEDGKLKFLLQKLQEAINAAMPACQKKYAALLAAANARNAKAASTVGSENGDFVEKDHKTEKNNLPRRKFHWTDQLRTLICDVVSIKMKCFEVSKLRSQSAEEYLQLFLEKDVKPLWPQGWMHTRTLLKESSAAHAYLTCKPRKNIGGTTKKTISLPIPAEVTLTKQVINLNGLAQPIPSASSTTIIADSISNIRTNKSPSYSSSLLTVENSVVTTTGSITSVSSNSAVTVISMPSSTVLVPTTTIATATTTVVATTSSPATTTTTTVSTPLVTPSVITRTVLPSNDSVLSTSAINVVPVSSIKDDNDDGGGVGGGGSNVNNTKNINSTAVGSLNVITQVKSEPSIIVPAVCNGHPVVVTETSKSIVTTQSSIKHDVTYLSASKLQETSSPVNRKLSADNSTLPRLNNSLDLITVTSLLKQSNATSPSNNDLLGVGRVFPLFDYAEPVQTKPTETISSNDVLSQIIHASLGDFPNSSSITKTATIAGNVQFSSSSDFSSHGGNKVSATTSGTLGSSFSATKPVVTNSTASAHNHMDAKPAISRSQVSLLKNPPSSIKGENHSGSSGYSKIPDPLRSSTLLTAAATVPSADIQHNTQVSPHHKASSYGLVHDRSSKSSFTLPLQSSFEFQEAFERSLQGKGNQATALGVSTFPVASAAYCKDPSDSSLSAYATFTRKDISDLTHLGIQQASFSRKELVSEQPLNFSTGRSVSSANVSPTPLSSTNAIGSVITSSSYSSKVSPVPVGLSSPMKEGSKQQQQQQQQQQHTVSGHAPLRNTNLPQTSSYSSSSTSNSVRLISNKTSRGGTENTFSNPTHSSYLSSIPPITAASSSSQLRSHISLPTASNVVTQNTTTANHSHLSSSQAKSLPQISDLDFTQMLNSTWCNTSNSATSAAYSRHYSKLLPTITNNSSVSSCQGLKMAESSSKTSNSQPLQQQKGVMSRDAGISSMPTTSYGQSQGSY